MFNLFCTCGKYWYFHNNRGSYSQVFSSKKEAIETLIQICGNVAFILPDGGKTWPISELKLNLLQSPPDRFAYDHLMRLTNNSLFIYLEVTDIKSN